MERGKASQRQVFGVLDIGSSKIACLIASRVRSEGPSPGLRIVGVGHQRSRGVKSGIITDLAAAEAAVRAAVAQAERMAGLTLDSVYVSVSCGRLRSHNFRASVDIAGGLVGADDLARLMAGARAYAEREGRNLVHMNSIALELDGAPGSRSPVGMAARQLSARMHAVTADEAPLRNLLVLLERSYVPASGMMATPSASALSVTSEDERRIGVTVIDIGGGSTTVAVYAEGELTHVAAIPVGGSHITFDIARALHAPLTEAERIKTLYGSLVRAQSDEHETFAYPTIDGDEGDVQQTTRANLAEIVRPRVDEIYALVRERIVHCGPAGDGPVVLTGGASQLAGMADYAAIALGQAVRSGQPQPLSGLPQVASGPAFAAVTGLVRAAAASSSGAVSVAGGGMPEPGYLGRVGRWLRDGF